VRLALKSSDFYSIKGNLEKKMPTIESGSLKSQRDVSDEIELIDLLHVIWKWKYLIIGGTVFFALTAIIISLVMPKIYRIETVIRPGILSIEKEGKKNYIDKPENIKALIETGVFTNDILKSLGKPGVDDIPKVLKLKITLPKNSSTIKVCYESPHIEQGVRILSLLGEFLIGEYQDYVRYYKAEIDKDINIKKAEIQNAKTMKQSNEINVKNIKKRIHELESEIVFMNENTVDMINERKKFLLQEKNESNILSALLYSNTIQQNLQLANEYKDEIQNLKLQKENQLQRISELKNKLKKLLVEIENIKFKKNSIQNIQIIRKPVSSAFPVKPKKTIIVILATIAGAFIMIFAAFFLEYISRNMMPKGSNCKPDR
jgi:LPS O-antigen subunit length determinant protein (WzzB/FepE family)